MDFKQIQELIKLVNRTNISELKLKQEGFDITIRTNDYVQGQRTEVVQVPMQAAPTAQPAQAQPATTPAASQDTPAAASGGGEQKAEDAASGSGVEFKAPMIGTFYRRPGPDKDVFVNVGDSVKPGDVICIIEAMKLFNEIEYEGPAGTVTKIVAEDASPIEYDQVLIVVEPA